LPGELVAAAGQLLLGLAGLVDELTIIITPVVLGGGKRLFEGFSTSLDLEHLGVRQSQYATLIDYRVKRG
jgi:riboflavin biosynthesis pyrimidine reductase